MRWGPGGAFGLIAVLGLSLLTGPAAAVVPSLEPRNDFGDEVFLPGCTTAEQMECIEAIDYILDGQWVSAPGPFVVKTIESSDGNGGNIVYGPDKTYFDSPGLTHAGGAGQLAPQLIISPYINGPEYPAYKFALQPTSVGEDISGPIDPAGLASTTYRMTFRTAQLRPIFANMTSIGAQVTATAIPGGLRVSLSGEPGPSQFVGDEALAEKEDRFEAITREWYGFITDARFLDSEGRCDGKGIVAAYSNGYGGQPPEWDPRTGSLSFGTNGYHYGPDGEVYKGRAEVYVPGELARCLWQVDPRRTSRVEIEVYTDSGDEAAGTKSIAYDADTDMIRMIAIDFTFSRKDIVARPTPLKAKAGKTVCSVGRTMCVSLDRASKSAKVTVAKVSGASEVVAVAMRGAREDGKTQIQSPLRKGKATITVKLAGAKSKGQLWVLRTPSDFISSFEVG